MGSQSRLDARLAPPANLSSVTLRHEFFTADLGRPKWRGFRDRVVMHNARALVRYFAVMARRDFVVALSVVWAPAAGAPVWAMHP